MLFGREDTAFKSLTNVNTLENIDNIFAIVNLRVKSLPTQGSYNPNVGLIENHTLNLSKKTLILIRQINKTLLFQALLS